MKKKNITELYLKNIADSINYDSLPFEWIDFDLFYFSKYKKLYEYQQNAIKNAIKILYKYFYEFQQNKEKFFNFYKNNGLNEKFSLTINNKIIKDYFSVNENKIHFSNLVNRMNFWMATGSGKTLVIVKLLEILTQYIENDLIPNGDILFLTHREDLIEQFKNHINEFNFKYQIHSLKDYEKVKIQNKKVNIFYYRSDLISDEQKNSIIDFRNYDNNGKMYIILDEAHKGNKEDSKRQNYYTILSRNGFLFNFSATFTDEIDFVTCVYNFNLNKFIEEGYGKNIFISQSDLTELSKKTDFSEQEKQIIILKIFLLFTLIKKHKVENYYHKPLLLTLVNSVNTIDSDLYFLFKEIENISLNNNNEELLEIAKKKLIEEIGNENLIKQLTYQDILENVFNTNIPSNIEIIKIPNNNQEFALKFKTSDKPFALIKIGDITKWIKEKLHNYEIVEKFENESFFKQLNEDNSNINILMGSRAFYEGWDSNRPNIILFINIGKGTDAKKFVLQSVGRGVRIEPISFKKRRLQFLFNNNEITEEIYNKLKDNAKYLETLYIYGTKAKNLKDIFEILKDIKDEKILLKTQTTKFDFDLLIPVYNVINEEIKELKFEINNKDFELFKNYFNYIGEKIFLVKYECDVFTLKRIKESLENIDKYYKISDFVTEIKNIDFLIKKIISFFSIRPLVLTGFKKLENEINHYNNIKILKNKVYQQINISNHLYNPFILDKDKKSINTIQVKSEINFIYELKNHLKNKNGLLFNKFKKWGFSKLCENDNVYVPYFQSKTNKIEKFKPDFIFWAVDDNGVYYIIFIDPKGTEHTDAIRKIDGFINFVEKRNNNKNIIIKLFIKVNDIKNVTEKYRSYYFDDINKCIL